MPQPFGWPNGTRSAIVLVPTSADTVPPLVVEFQHAVDKKFIKRAI